MMETTTLDATGMEEIAVAATSTKSIAALANAWIQVTKAGVVSTQTAMPIAITGLDQVFATILGFRTCKRTARSLAFANVETVNKQMTT